MTHIEQAIKEAGRNGWDKEPYMCDHEGIRMLNKGAFLDLTFWQALCKARGYGIEYAEAWNSALVAHLHRGKDAESFFADLLPNNT